MGLLTLILQMTINWTTFLDQNRSYDDANEFPEAKVRYANCLYNGKGVEKNYSEALKYFEKAAEDGFKVAMYYNGIGCEKDIEKANH